MLRRFVEFNLCRNTIHAYQLCSYCDMHDCKMDSTRTIEKASTLSDKQQLVTVPDILVVSCLVTLVLQQITRFA